MSMLSFSCTILGTWEAIVVFVSHVIVPELECLPVADPPYRLFATGFTKCAVLRFML